MASPASSASNNPSVSLQPQGRAPHEFEINGKRYHLTSIYTRGGVHQEWDEQLDFSKVDPQLMLNAINKAKAAFAHVDAKYLKGSFSLTLHEGRTTPLQFNFLFIPFAGEPQITHRAAYIIHDKYSKAFHLNRLPDTAQPALQELGDAVHTLRPQLKKMGKPETAKPLPVGLVEKEVKGSTSQFNSPTVNRKKNESTSKKEAGKETEASFRLAEEQNAVYVGCTSISANFVSKALNNQLDLANMTPAKIDQVVNEGQVKHLQNPVIRETIEARVTEKYDLGLANMFDEINDLEKAAAAKKAANVALRNYFLEADEVPADAYQLQTADIQTADITLAGNGDKETLTTFFSQLQNNNALAQQDKTGALLTFRGETYGIVFDRNTTKFYFFDSHHNPAHVLQFDSANKMATYLTQHNTRNSFAHEPAPQYPISVGPLTEEQQQAYQAAVHANNLRNQVSLHAFIPT